jgi:hypothetical protein
MHQIQFAHKVKCSGLPACGRKRGGIACILRLRLALNDTMEVNIKEEQEDEDSEDQQEKNDSLS